MSLAGVLTREIHLGDTEVTFQILDTYEQEIYDSLHDMIYFHGAQAAIVLYSIKDPTSFYRAKYWVEELRQYSSPHMVIALAGMLDADSGRRMVNYQVK